MKKVTFLFSALMATSGALSIHAQNQLSNQAEKAPVAEGVHVVASGKTEALWDVQKNLNLTAASGNVGMAGVMFYNNHFWVSEWNSDSLFRYSATGTVVEKFVIAGLSGVRSLTTDGTLVYAGTAAGTIYKINPVTKTLAPPHITLPGGVVARFCTYDHTLNGGAGGFWVGNFNTAIDAVSMSGTLLSSIPATTHGLGGMYGAAADYHTTGGPFLWVFHQEGANTCQITKLKLPGGTSTGVTHDAYPDVSASNSLTSGLAGGAFLTDEIVTGLASLVCLVQGSPNNVIVAYELGVSSFDIDENSRFQFNVFPNPSRDFVTISLNSNVENGSYELTDATGRVVYAGALEAVETTLNLQDMAVGNYILSVFVDGNKMAEQKIIKM